MSNIRRDSKSSTNPKDDHRKRTNSTRSNDQSNLQRISNLDAKVYVGNVPTDNLTDGELLDFFKPFGKISDIRVYKGYIFVQYDRIDDANKLIQQGQTSLILKGNKLDVLPAMDGNSINTKSSSIEMSYKDYKSSERQSSRNSRRHSSHDRHSSNYQPPRKRYPPKHHTDDHERFRSNFILNYGDSNPMELDDNLRSCSRRSPNDSLSRNQQSSYTILTGPDDPKQLVDCRIIIVNPRQRGYAEEISSHLRCHGLITSIILLREDYTLTEAIQNASNDQCLYGIIAMPMHEERNTASFHILYGQTEEHRNLTLEDGFHIILTNFGLYKERIRNEEINNSQSKEFIRQDQSTITLGDKLPLSMLLCLLADGRQLTLDEIDRVLVYLLEKKAKMLTLPQGTLPPLPAKYATAKIDESKATIDSSSSSDLSSTIAEQIRQIFSTNLIKPSSLISTDDQQISNIIKTDESKLNLNEGDQEKCFSYSKSNSNSIPVVTPSFHYSSSIPTNGISSNSFLQTDFSSINSPLKPIPTEENFASQYFYPTSTIQNQNIYSTLPNSAAADAAAAIFQAYSQFNARPTNTQHQQTQK